MSAKRGKTPPGSDFYERDHTPEMLYNRVEVMHVKTYPVIIEQEGDGYVVPCPIIENLTESIESLSKDEQKELTKNYLKKWLLMKLGRY